MSQEPAENSTLIGRWMIVGLWILILIFLTLQAQRWLDRRAEARAPVLVNGGAGLELSADRLGHYQLTGKINGQPVEFLIDTGASELSIPAGVARRLNLDRGRGFQVSTANGSITVYATQLDSVSLGPLRQTAVRAHINPAMEGDVALLGMSFLRHFDLSQRAGHLTIGQL